MKIHISHRTSYQYALKVLLGPHRLMMRPREGHGVRLDTCTFTVSLPHRMRWMRDLHENNIGLIDFTELASEMVIEGQFTLDITERNPFDFMLLPEAAEYPFTYDHDLMAELLPLSQNIYLRDVDRIRSFLDPFWHPGKKVETLQLLQQLNLHIYRTFRYQRREQRGVLSPAETIENNGGSCRDFATLFMEVCRFMGLAARFVSGYMYSPEITGRMSMHGWAEVYLPGAGWIGFDPSWGLLATFNYFPAAVSRHSEHAPPISGTYLGTPRNFLRSQVDLHVTRIDGITAPDPGFEATEPIAVLESGMLRVQEPVRSTISIPFIPGRQTTPSRSSQSQNQS